jgi:putative ABC transport system permease protein
VATILNAAGIAHDAKGQAIAEAEVLAQLQVPQRDAKPVNVSLRGVGVMEGALRPEARVIRGRMFHPGVHEFVVGQNAEARYPPLRIGGHLRFQNADWVIVGVIGSTGVSAIDSEVLTDAETLLSSYQRNWFQSVTARLESRESLEQLKRSLASDQRLQVDVHRESDYSAAQSRALSGLLKVMGYFIGSMMAIGAVFGALNSLYATVSTRSREIATLRALGFSSSAVVVSVLAEALLLACIGALLGAAAAWLFFDGHITSMSSGGLQSQLAFAMSVPSKLIAAGIIWGCAIGLVGGLFPALRAARLPIVRGLSAEG